MSPPATVVLRPLATPLPLGFVGLFSATTAFAALQLGWIPPQQGHPVALAVLLLTAPVQLLVAVLGFLARDPVAGTGMGVLGGTWATVGAATLTSPPGSTSPGLGVVLLTTAVALLLPAVAASGKPVAAAVMALSAVRFAVTGVAETTGAPGWMTAAGIAGLVLAVVSLYAALALELEGVRGRAVLPTGRRAPAAEPGVREQL